MILKKWLMGITSNGITRMVFNKRFAPGALHTKAEGQEVVNFHQSYCKKPKVRPRPFTVRPKSKGRRNLKCLLSNEGHGLSKKVWVGREWKPELWLRGYRYIFHN
jgi:hypothetical protein